MFASSLSMFCSSLLRRDSEGRKSEAEGEEGEIMFALPMFCGRFEKRARRCVLFACPRSFKVSPVSWIWQE